MRTVRPYVLTFVSLLAHAATACAAAESEAPEDDISSDESDLTKRSFLDRLAGHDSDHPFRAFALEGDPTLQVLMVRERIRAPIREFLEIPNFRMSGDVINFYERDTSGPSRKENWSERSPVSTTHRPKGTVGQIELSMQQSVLFLGTTRPQPVPSARPTTFRVDVVEVDDHHLVLRGPSGKKFTFRSLDLERAW